MSKSRTTQKAPAATSSTAAGAQPAAPPSPAAATGEAASSVSTDAATQSPGQGSETTPAAASTVSSTEARPEVQPSGREATAEGEIIFRSDDSLEGSSILPAAVPVAGETVPLGHIVSAAFAASELAVDAWNDLNPALREQLLEIFVQAADTMGQAVRRIRDLAANASAAEVTITARSKDGKPFRRCGHVFGATFSTVGVTADEAERIRADRSLVVKADA